MNAVLFLALSDTPWAMSLVNVLNVTIADNPSAFLRPFSFEITFECLSSLDRGDCVCLVHRCLIPCCVDLECQIVYVGSAESDKYDQVLDSINVGPVPLGINKFTFQVTASLGGLSR
jgi:histone chaperone ASF1